jgi:hypothetical protein
MRDSKLRLNVDELSVESFSPSGQEQALGTVRGAEASIESGCVDCLVSGASCAWTQCQNISCLAGEGCGTTDRTLRQDTCHLTCGDTNPPPIE